MKTKIIFAVRCNPIITQNKLKNIKGNGTAYITELIRNKKGESICSTKGFTRVANFEILKKAAELGSNVIYKTASLSCCSKLYIETEYLNKI